MERCVDKSKLLKYLVNSRLFMLPIFYKKMFCMVLIKKLFGFHIFSHLESSFKNKQEYNAQIFSRIT